MHVVSRWINISPSPFLQLAVATSDQLAAAITSDGAIFILPLQGGDPTILQMALTRATSIAWTSYNDLLVGFSDGLVVALSVDAKLNISVRDWIPSYFPGKILSLHSVGSLTAVTQGNTFELWKQDLHRVDGWEPVGQICVTEEDILGTWLIDEGKISILCSDCHIRFVDNTTSASALPVTGVGQGPFSAADVLPVVHSVFCAVLALAQEHRVLVYLLSVHTTGVMAVGPRTYEAEAAIMEVKLGQQVDSAFVAVDLGLEGLLCLAIPLVPGFEDFPSIKNVGIPPDQTVDSIEAKGDKIAIGLSFEHGAYGIQIHGSKSLKSDVFVFDGNGSAIRHVDLSTSLHRAIRGRKYLRHLPSIIQYPFIATAQYVPSQLKEFFFGFYWRKIFLCLFLLLITGWFTNSPEGESNESIVSEPATDPLNNRDLTASSKATLIVIAGRLLLEAAAQSFSSFIRAIGHRICYHLLRSILGISGWVRILNPALRLPDISTFVHKMTNAITAWIVSVYTALLSKSCEYLEGQGYSCVV